jgi:hypothetical protein
VNIEKLNMMDALSGMKTMCKSGVIKMQKTLLKPALRSYFETHLQAAQQDAAGKSAAAGVPSIQMNIGAGLKTVQQLDISIDAAAATRSYNHHYKSRQLTFLVVSSLTGLPIARLRADEQLLPRVFPRDERGQTKASPRWLLLESLPGYWHCRSKHSKIVG